ncbi:MAG: RagB/SusD family nutrient uptake outer membrane protein [Candidatus Cryptobacteroides sp.]
MMKRIRIAIAALLATVAVGSCNLDKFPHSAISTDEALQSPEDCRSFLVGLYSGMKYVFTGAMIYAPELQTDLYHAVQNFGNFEGDFYHWSIQASNSTATSVWYGLYSYIGNANFLIEGAQNLMNSGTLSEDQFSAVSEYYGEACYIRAHMYYLLANYFCEDYDPDLASEQLGVPVVTLYRPTPDQSKYPKRDNLQVVYDQILNDLDEATNYITTNGSPMSAYVTKDVVLALQARVALSMEDYGVAYNKAVSVINTNRYPLVSDKTAYARGWTDDTLSEAIWQVKMTSMTDIGNGFPYFIYNQSGEAGDDNPQYVPEQWILDLYDSNDIRYDAYFQERSITTPVTGKLTLFIKYPGNRNLYAAVTNYVNMPKVFRISEMYLIAAEAAAMKSTPDVDNANLYLNALKAKRITGWTTKQYSPTELMPEIKRERVRELYGEGQRLFDLKRWHDDIVRSAGQQDELIFQGENYANLHKTYAEDKDNYVWPIPTAEMQSNPQMQQNPAYTNQ